MARYSAEQIYGFARQAGFSPDEAATMTAIALAESRGDSGAHNPRGEDSRGLWQINAAVHPQFAKYDLYDPAQNARAAFEISHGGNDMSPWTTTHGGVSARYVRHRSEAEQAAIAYGDGPGHGVWTGTASYKDHRPAGRDDGADQGKSGQRDEGSNAVVVNHPAAAQPEAAAPAGAEYGIALGHTETPVAPAGAEYSIPLGDAPPVAAVVPAVADTPVVRPQVATGDGAKLQQFLDVAVAQTGDRYVWGAKPGKDDPDPKSFDCSALVQWASHQVGVELPRTAWTQYEHLKAYAIPVDQAIHTPGALLFSFSSDPDGGHPKSSHVAISMGNGKTMEAMGDKYGVGSWNATPKRFAYAVLIPGVSDAPGAAAVAAGGGAAAPPDQFEYRIAADPAGMDSNPAVLAASENITAAAPAAAPGPEAVPHNDFGVPAADVNEDGMDDALHNAAEYAVDHGYPQSDPDHWDQGEQDAAAAH